MKKKYPSKVWIRKADLEAAEDVYCELSTAIISIVPQKEDFAQEYTLKEVKEPKPMVPGSHDVTLHVTEDHLYTLLTALDIYASYCTKHKVRQEWQDGANEVRRQVSDYMRGNVVCCPQCAHYRQMEDFSHPCCNVKREWVEDYQPRCGMYMAKE